VLRGRRQSAILLTGLCALVGTIVLMLSGGPVVGQTGGYGGSTTVPPTTNPGPTTTSGPTTTTPGGTTTSTPGATTTTTPGATTTTTPGTFTGECHTTTNVGNVGPGSTFTGISCQLFVGGSTVNLFLNGQSAGTKQADVNGNVTLTIQVLALNAVVVDDMAPAACGPNTVTGMGPAPDGNNSTETVLFNFVCPAGVPNGSVVGPGGSIVAPNGTVVLPAGSVPLGLVSTAPFALAGYNGLGYNGLVYPGGVSPYLYGTPGLVGTGNLAVPAAVGSGTSAAGSSGAGANGAVGTGAGTNGAVAGTSGNRSQTAFTGANILRMVAVALAAIIAGLVLLRLRRRGVLS
jgi:mucin-2